MRPVTGTVTLEMDMLPCRSRPPMQWRKFLTSQASRLCIVQEKKYRRLREEPTSPTESHPNKTMKIEIQQQLQVQAGGISD